MLTNNERCFRNVKVRYNFELSHVKNFTIPLTHFVEKNKDVKMYLVFIFSEEKSLPYITKCSEYKNYHILNTIFNSRLV